MHRTGRFSHMEEVVHVCQNAFRKSVRHFVLVNPVRGPLQSAEASKRPTRTNRFRLLGEWA